MLSASYQILSHICLVRHRGYLVLLPYLVHYDDVVSGHNTVLKRDKSGEEAGDKMNWCQTTHTYLVSF